MREARLASSVRVGAMLRQASAAGDFATVLRRGDDDAGDIIVIHRNRAQPERALRQVMSSVDQAVWQVVATGDSVAVWLERQYRYDPDLWVVELDTPNLARFIDEMIV